MSMSPQKAAQLHDLVAEACNDTLVDTEFARLEHLLTNDRAAQTFYVRYLDMHRSLGQFARGLEYGKSLQDIETAIKELRGLIGVTFGLDDAGLLNSHPSNRTHNRNDLSSLPDLMGLSDWDFSTVEAESSNLLSWSAAHRQSKRGTAATLINACSRLTTSVHNGFRSIAGRVAALLAIVVVGIVAVAFLMQPPPSVTVAYLEQAVNCRWQNGDSSDMTELTSLKEGAELISGQTLDLASGRASLRFVNGVSVVVDAPARIRLGSSGDAQLHHGAILASVPPQAVGFTVTTPHSRIIDLGTEFVLVVDGSRSTEVQVLKGRVEAAHRQSNGSFSVPQTLVAGEALRTSASGVSEKIAFKPTVERFTQLVKQPIKKTTLGLAVMVHYRLGEDDRPDERFVTRPLVGNLPLRNPAAILYVTDTALRVSDRAVSLKGKADEFFQAELPPRRQVENWVLEAWVRPRTIKNSVVVQNGDPSSDGCGLWIRDGKWSGRVKGHAFTINAPCIAGRWTHLALVRQHGRTGLWVNTVQFIEDVPDLQFVPKSGAFAIGGYPGQPSDTFDGEIDEVRYSAIESPFNPSMLLFGIEDTDNMSEEN